MRLMALFFAVVWLVVAGLFMVLAIATLASGLWIISPFLVLFAAMSWKTCRICWRTATELPR